MPGALRTAWAHNGTVIAITVATTMAALVAGFRTTPALATWLFEVTTYWFLWLGVLLAASVLVAMRVRGEIERAPAREVAAIVACAAVLAGLVHLAIPCEFRVLADETNLLGTSLSFYLHRTALNVTQALYEHGAFRVVEAFPPSRPCLFPFSISLVHSVVGFGDGHGFAVNWTAGFCTLIVTAWLGRRLVSLPFGLLAAVLVAALPLFPLAMTSCGFEALNLLFVMLILAQILSLTERPTALRAEALLALCALGAQCRYETFVLFVPALLACALRWRDLAGARWSPRIAAYPLLVAPLVWQRRLTTVVNQGDVTSAPFSAAFIPAHARDLAQFFWSGQHPEFPTLRTLTGLAVTGAVLFVVRTIRRRCWTEPRTQGVLLVGLGMLLVALVQTAFYLGDVRYAFQSRFAATYAGVLGLLAAYPLHLLFSQRVAGRAIAATAAAVVLWLGVRVARANELGDSLLLTRSYGGIMAVLGDHDRATSLVVAGRPGMYASRMFGAATIATAVERAPAIAASLESGELHEVLLVQETACAAPVRGLDLGAGFEDEVVLTQEGENGRCERVIREVYPR